MLERIRSHNVKLSVRKKSVNKWNVSPEVQSEVLRFLDDLAIGKVNRGKRVGDGAQLKYFDMLKISLPFFQKPTASLQHSDVEQFEKSLHADKIRSPLKGTPYSTATKSAARKALKVFLRWRLGESKAVELAGWLDTRDKAKTPEFLWEQEIDRLFKKCRTAEQRYIVAVLFDSGARAEEFINIRLEDIRFPEGKENFVKIALKDEFSKTKGRTISLYWRHSLEAIKDFLNERTSQGLKSRDPVFISSYDSMRMFLRRLGNEVLKKPVHPHLFRHSSATYYATRMNRQELCYRYGWRFSSNMPDIYISRAGMENKQLDEKFTNIELGELKDQLTQKDQSDKIKEDRIQRLELAIETLLHKGTDTKITSGDVAAILKKKRSGNGS